MTVSDSMDVVRKKETVNILLSEIACPNLITSFKKIKVAYNYFGNVANFL
jgi:hypothetical protein